MNQTQTTQKLTQNNFALKKLKGIKPKGVKTKSNSKLEVLLNVEKQVVKRTEFYIDDLGLSTKIMTDLPVAKLFVDEAVHKYLINFDYSTNDLISYLQAKSVEEHPKVGIAQGLFTGSLLSLLNQKNREKGKRTIVYFDGNGCKFDNLFLMAKHSDILILNNLKGDNICKGIASNSGRANILVGSNIVGKNCFMSVGSSKGYCNLLIGQNVTNSDNFNFLRSFANEEGELDIVIADNFPDYVVITGALLDAPRANFLYTSKMVLKGTDDYPKSKYASLVSVIESKSTSSPRSKSTFNSKYYPEKIEQYKNKFRVQEMLDLVDKINTESDEKKIKLILELEKIYKDVKTY